MYRNMKNKIYSGEYGFINGKLRKAAVLFVSVIMIMSLAACGAAGSTGAIMDSENALNKNSDPNKLQIVTTIFPEYDWVREIAGLGANSVDKSAVDSIELTMLLDNGVDLHSFQPTAADIAKISTCDMFIYVGGESDFWVDDALKESINKDMVVIDLLDVLGGSVKEEEVVEGMQEEEEEHEHEHGEAEADEEEKGPEYDEHVWLSLKDSQVLCSEIAKKLGEIDPEHAEAYNANADNYVSKLAALDQEYQSAVDNAKVKTILFGDRFPFRYMADDYGIDYYAAFVGCSAETEASFETVIFLSGKVDELKLPAICTIENSDQKIANTIKDNTTAKDQEIIAFNSLQSTTSKNVEEGV
ncbi:zinc transport system substrate-binding protein [Lachnospiraceae bacterium]|nr:zinc transport system substrate-binding protein [Lachnospiraceae bacterium]